MKQTHEKITKLKTQTSNAIANANGKIVVPILLYLLGVPGIIVVLLWLFFFRG